MEELKWHIDTEAERDFVTFRFSSFLKEDPLMKFKLVGSGIFLALLVENQK